MKKRKRGRPRIHPRKRGRPRKAKITDIRKRVGAIENEIKNARGYRKGNDKTQHPAIHPNCENDIIIPMPADLVKNLDDVDMAAELLRLKIVKYDKPKNIPAFAALINHAREAINHAANMAKAVINCAQEDQ